MAEEEPEGQNIELVFEDVNEWGDLDNGDQDDKEKNGDKNIQKGYHPPPKYGLPAFPEAGSGAYNPKSKRWRWKLPNGDILEWDKQHGEVERYDRTGKKHKGAFDPNSGEQVKDPIKNRTTPKFDGPTYEPHPQSPNSTSPVTPSKVSGFWDGFRKYLPQVFL